MFPTSGISACFRDASPRSSEYQTLCRNHQNRGCAGSYVTSPLFTPHLNSYPRFRIVAEKLKQEGRQEMFSTETTEELEDDDGNVYNRKTYEDLKKQGII